VLAHVWLPHHDHHHALHSMQCTLSMVQLAECDPPTGVPAVQLVTNGSTRVNLPVTTLNLMGAQLAGQAALPAAYPPGGLYFPTFSW
jgi:hypothetical protein